jgi:DNA polymerase-3 subunit alpha
MPPLSDKKINDLINTYFSMHDHSWYSNIRLLDSINRPDELIKYAISLGLRGICLTDHEALSGHVQFIQAFKKLKQDKNFHVPDDFKIGLGDEIYLVNEDSLDELKENYKNKNPDTRFYHFLLLAKDLEGYKQLRILSSKAWENEFSTGFMDRVPTFKNDFKEILQGGHVIGTSACLGGFLPTMIIKLRDAEAIQEKDKIKYYKLQIDKFIKFCIDVLGKENFFFELQPTPNEEQYYVNRFLINLSKVYNVRYTIATDAHYLKKEDREAHKIYLQSAEGEREVDDFYASTYVMSAKEIREYMGNELTDEEINEGFRTTLMIADQIEQYDLYHKTIIPTTIIPDFKIRHIFKPAYEQFEYIKNFAYSDYKIDQYLLYLIENGFDEKLRNNKLTKNYFYTVMDRINIELREIWKISIKLEDRLSSYYVLTKKIVDLVWSKGDSIVGVSRGSAGGFLINFLLGIIQMNPLDYNLPHFRHLTAERPELPK